MPDLKMKTTAQSISFFGFSTWTTNLSLRRFLLFVFSVCLTCFLLVAKNCFCVLSPPTRLKSFPRVLHAFNRGTAVYSWFGPQIWCQWWIEKKFFKYHSLSLSCLALSLSYFMPACNWISQFGHMRVVFGQSGQHLDFWKSWKFETVFASEKK